MKSKGVLIAVLVVAFVAVAGGSFWLGAYYENQTRASRMRQFIGSGNQGQLPGMPPGGDQAGMPNGQPRGQMGITGKVDRVEANTITITTRFGSQKITFSSDVGVNKPSSGSIDDVKKGAEILVEGERDSDGKIQAEKIQIISQ